MNKDYNLYKIFMYLYEEKSISKVAQKLFVSQPAISYSLKELEYEIGVPLFVRNNKGIEPNKNADELYKYIKTAFNILETGEKRISEYDENYDTIIKIGSPSHISYYFLCNIIQEFNKKYKNVSFQIYSKPNKDMINMLETRELDLIFSVLPLNTQLTSIKTVYLKELKNCFAYSKKKHSDYKINNVKDLTKYPLVLPSLDAPAYSDLTKYMLNKGINIKGIINCWTTESIIELTKQGLGVGYFFKDFISNDPDKYDLEIIEFDNNLPSLRLAVSYNEDITTPIINELIDLIKEQYE